MTKAEMARRRIEPLAYLWVVYVDKKPAVWCTSKREAEKYRRWGKRKRRRSINIVRYDCE